MFRENRAQKPGIGNNATELIRSALCAPVFALICYYIGAML